VRLYLVRHAAVTVRPTKPSAQWHLSAEGRAAAEALAEDDQWASVAVVYCSTEPKAIGTAQRIAWRHGLRLQIEHDLHEVERPWTEGDYRALVQRYFAGDSLDGWEPRGDALVRVRVAIGAIASMSENAAIVSHGLALMLYVSEIEGLDGRQTFEMWSGISFPDVAVVVEGRMVRGFGE
jgi:broad specificity phosphatase PhoE